MPEHFRPQATESLLNASERRTVCQSPLGGGRPMPGRLGDALPPENVLLKRGGARGYPSEGE